MSPHLLKSMFTVFLFLLATPLLAEPSERGNETIGDSGLALPRFVSISADTANMRTGPGEQHPIEWVYKRKLYPLEIIAEYDQWRQVRDIDGTMGWMHVVLLSGKRTGLVTGGTHTLFEKANTTSFPTAHVQAGVVGEILECTPAWCRLDFDGTKGWLETSQIWGTYIGEEFN